MTTPVSSPAEQNDETEREALIRRVEQLDGHLNWTEIHAITTALRSSPAATTREWEYGIKYLGNFTPRFEAFARQQAKDGAGSLVRRTPAGPWSPVPKGDE